MVVLAACGHGRALESEALVPQDPGDLEGTSWVLVASGDVEAVPPEGTATLHIGDGTASGAAPCNTFRIPFTVDGDDLTTGPAAATRKECAAAVMSAERSFLEALEVADTVEIVSDRLVVTGPDDGRLVFARSDASPDLAGVWYVTSEPADDAAGTGGRPPRLDFHDDGTLGVDSGCNTGVAAWTVQGRSLRITPSAMTSKACVDPPGAMEREASLVQALSRVATAERDDHTAVLTDGDGAVVLVLAREEP